ncbi:MAG: filamentous hemagglutinin N-terminal domain-containing protein [Verrucomicrobiales bacterium]
MTPPHPFRAARLAARLLAAAILATAGPVAANPAGETVRFGDVRFERAGNRLTVLQGTDRAIIDWNDFSIGGDEVTRFKQPTSESAALNRVQGRHVSRIDGALRANGNILLLNPNGILVGASGTIDVGGFVGSTLDVEDSEFLAGGDLQFRGSSQGAVINLGRISASHGDVFLMAATVDNSGLVQAPRGTAGLAAGNDILLKESGEERVYVRGASGGKKENGVINRGTVEANVAELKSHGGNIYGMAVKNEGRVAATSVSREGGQIFLRAGGGGTVRSTGTLQGKRNSGEEGGRIVADAGADGKTEIGGEVDASGEEGAGGSVLVLGREIDVFEDSLILADGDSAGGRVYIGGGREGEDPAFHNATDVTVGGGARIDAGARVAGNGGEIVVFANRSLTFQGRAEARGGSVSGDGGFVELSGKESVRIPGLVESVDVGAPNGRGGLFLLDPNDIFIESGSGSPIQFEPDDGGETAISLNTLYADDISNFLQSNGSLVIQTDEDPSFQGSGNITVKNGVLISWASDNNLTFMALNDFRMEGDTSIAVGGGNGGLSVEAGGSAIFLGDGQVSIATVAGDISVSGQRGVELAGASFGTDSGDIAITGIGGPGADGVAISGSSLVSNSGNITIEGTGGAGTSRGIHIFGEVGSTMESGSDALVGLTGQGQGGGAAIDIAEIVPGFELGPGSLVSGDGTQDLLLRTLGGEVVTHGIRADRLLLEDLSSNGENFTLNDSMVNFLTSTPAGNIAIENWSNLALGDIGVAGTLAVTGPQSLDIVGTVRAGTGIDLGLSYDPYYYSNDFQFRGDGRLVAPDVLLDGGSGAWVGVERTLDLTNHRFENIDFFQGRTTESKLVASAAGEHIRIEAVDSGAYFGGGGPTAAAVIGGLPFFDFGEISGGAGADTVTVDLPEGVHFNGSVTGGRGNDLFYLLPSGGGLAGTLAGGGGFDTLSYEHFTSGITVAPGSNVFPAVANVESIERVVGSSARDTLAGTPNADVFRITGPNSGRLNAGFFESFETLVGGGGPDRFEFFNQATVSGVVGGGGNDLLWIDDRNLGGANTYRISDNWIARNPVYRFSGIEAIQMSLGFGDDTVITGPRSFVQILDGGRGHDRLDLPGGRALDSNPILLAGGQPIVHANFEDPAPDDSVVGNGGGSLLTLQLDNGEQRAEIGGRKGDGGEERNLFNNANAVDEGTRLFRDNLFASQTGAFAAALAGQATVILVDGTEYLMFAPASLDGQFSVPPVIVISDLRETLGIDAFAELAEALDHGGAALLIPSDGPYAIDLDGPPDAAVVALLQELLNRAAASELFAALQMTLAIPVTSEDGVVSIVAVPVQPDPAVVAALGVLLNDAAFGELTSALDE